MRKREQDALEAAARHFSATWLMGEGPSDAYVTIARKRIAVEVVALEPRIVDRSRLAKPRLRFDRVALGLIGRLQAAASRAVTDDRTALFTVTAPIRLPAKTAAALEEKIHLLLARRSQPIEIRKTIHGNGIRMRLVAVGSRGTSKLIGFVHNPGSDPDVLLDIAQSLRTAIRTAGSRRAPAGFVGERWLVLANQDGLVDVETYRHVLAQGTVPAGFNRILMVLAGGWVESLPGGAPSGRPLRGRPFFAVSRSSGSAREASAGPAERWRFPAARACGARSWCSPEGPSGLPW